MSAKANAPIIIKRKKVVGGDGHHGGAWKVAYADFVTAMMAFFLLMWLLNATTEQQRKGLADYFAPTIAVSRTSGGGEGSFGGTDIMSDDTMVMTNKGGAFVTLENPVAGQVDAANDSVAAEVELLRDLEQVLLGKGGESVLSDEALRHVITKLTDEGLVIELFSLPGAPLFEGTSDVPRHVTVELLEMVARVIGVVPNQIAIGAHIPPQPVVLRDNPIWDATTARANITREVLEIGGLAPGRIDRMTGHGDRSPVVDQPLDPRNDRIEIIILRNIN